MALFKIRDRARARQLRRQLVREYGQEAFDNAEAVMVDCWRETGDIGLAKDLFEKTLRSRQQELGSIALVVSIIQLAFLVYKFLKWMEWLSPSPEQLQSIYADDAET